MPLQMQLKECAEVLPQANPEYTEKDTKQSTSLSFSHQSEWNCWMCQYTMASGMMHLVISDN